MARSSLMKGGSRTAALRYLTKLIAETMQADFVGYWRYVDQRSGIIADCIYDPHTGKWLEGQEISKQAYPKYFSFLEEERILAVNDCFQDPITQELEHIYLVPNNIHALVDVPVLFDGEMVGILCCEVKGKSRVWSNEDKFFALSCADFIGRVLETEQRHIFESQLKAKIISENMDLSEVQLKSILMSFPSAVALLDREHRFVTYTAKWLKDYPFSVPDALGVRIQDAYVGFKDFWVNRINLVLNGQEQGMEEELIRVGESDRWLTWRMIPWRSFNGEIEGALIIQDDITEKKEAEFHLRQATKLTALGEMAGGIAHEINNPLSILKGFIDLMRRQIARGNVDMLTFQQYMDRAYNTVDRISRIVKGMKRIARDSSQDVMQPYELNSLVDDALDFVKEKFRDNGMTLNFKRLDANVIVFCRPVEISQVLLNLFTNSFHAIEGEATPWMRVECEVADKTAIISVEDSGRGIHPSIRDKIFQPFFTTKDIGKGTGLGLSISRRIVEGHSGKLSVDTTAPHTRFVIELPLE